MTNPAGGVIQASFSGGPEGLRRLSFPGAARAAAGVTAVPVPAERLRPKVPGGGQPLPAAVQSRMESLFGADFSRVRVHVDERPAALGALAYAQGSDLHFAPGRYDPVSPAGQRLLAHELAHVVQQRAGRARNPFGSGVALVHDPALEAEAERMAQRAAGGSGVAQPYFQITTRDVYTSRRTLRDKRRFRALVSETSGFHAQVKGDSEFLAGERARIESKTRVGLRVSDDCRMAIEDTDLSGRQPKVFFATDEVVRASNAALESAGSGIRLIQRGQTVRIFSKKNVEYVLRAVYPAPHDSWWVREPLRMRANQNCNDVATSVIGIKSDTQSVVASAPPGTPAGISTIARQVHYTVADLVAKVLRKGDTGFVYDTRTVATDEDWKTGQGARKMRQAIDQISREYAKALRRGSADDLLRSWGINRHADPGVGEAFVIHSVAAESGGRITDWDSGRSFAPPWPYHWGGVVAKSGSDVVTLENYARPGGGNRSADPRWYFQMYGRKEGQSFHEAWQSSGAFANPVTLAMRNPNPPQVRRSRINWKLVLILLVIAVLLWIGLLIYRRM